MANTIGLVTHSIQPYLYKISYILSKNSQSLRLNGYGFYAILYWFYPSTSGTVIYSSSGICTIPELIQNNKNLFTRVLKTSVYRVKKIRIPLGNSILFLTLGFDKVTPGIISQRFGRYEGYSSGDKVSAKVDISARINIFTSINLLIRFVLNGVNFNILEMILSFKVVSIYSITGDKVNSFPTIKITE